MNSRRLQSSQFSQGSTPLRRETRQKLQISTMDIRMKNQPFYQPDMVLSKYLRQKQRDRDRQRERERNSSSRFRISSKPSISIPGIKPLFITLRDQQMSKSQLPELFNSQLIQVQNESMRQQYSVQIQQKQVVQNLVSSRSPTKHYNQTQYPLDSKSPKTAFLKKKISNPATKQEQDLQSKLQMNLRIHIPNISQNVDTLMTYYNRKMKLQYDTKVFVFNSKDDYIRRVLIHWGWIQNRVIDSPFYHLKWTYIDTSNDHKSLSRQILNHFKNNQEMTSKGGLMKNMKGNYYGNVGLDDFVPRSYDLTVVSDADCFYYQYERATLMAILKKHYRWFKEMVGKEKFGKMIKEVEQKKRKEKMRWRVKKYEQEKIDRKCPIEIGKYEDKQNLNQDFVVDVTVLIQCIRYYRYQMKIQQDEDWKNPSSFLSYNKQQFIRYFPSIQRYSRSSPPYSNYHTIQNNYSTPSSKLIKQIIKYYIYFQSKNKSTWKSDGQNNIWVIKPANNSRGNGIFLNDDCMEIINSSEGHNRIVQKYIENPLICKNIEYPLLYNRKFDIRQWVLVTSYNPLVAYMFSSCYLRICSQNYDIKDIKSLQKHLTNYSFNKSNFINKKQQSIQSLQNFKDYLSSQHSVSWQDQIKPQIKTIIFDTLISCSDSIQDTPNRFQLYGFDILIDEQFNPWLLEVNLSPACQERTDFLKEYCECMGQQLLRIVLPLGYCEEQSLNQNQRRYNWERLPDYYEDRERDWEKERKREEIEISGVKTNIKLEKKLEKGYNQNSAAVIIQSVMKMAKPKRELKELKWVFLAKGFQKYVRFVIAKKQYTDRITSVTKKDAQKYLLTTIVCEEYEDKLKGYCSNMIQKYIKMIPARVKFTNLRLHQSVKRIQSIYQHYQCLKIIQNHKHSTSMVKKIQRWYRTHYKLKINSANTIKKYLKLHLYNKKRKQFLLDLQQYTNRIVIEKYLVSFKIIQQMELKKIKMNQKIIEKSFTQFLQLQKLTKKKLAIFDRQVGRVMRVNIRRTRVFYFPTIKQYAKQKVKLNFNLEKYFRGFVQLSTVYKKKLRRHNTKIISRHLKGMLAHSMFLKRKELYQIVEKSLFSSKREDQSNITTNSKIERCLPILEERDRERDSRHKSKSKVEILVKPREKMPMIYRHEEQEKLSKYIIKMRDHRGSNNKNNRKQ